jgi:hypothetical protein
LVATISDLSITVETLGIYSDRGAHQLCQKNIFHCWREGRVRDVRSRSDKANKVKAEREVRQWIYDIIRKAIPDGVNVTFFASVRRRSAFRIVHYRR